MAKSMADLWKAAGDLEKEGEDVANFKESVAKLPFQLSDKFREAQDPELDKAINKAQSDTFGAAIKGLDMYKDISDPFARRALAEEYQGGVSQGYKNLTDERTRRQGVYSDYITKWTGLFGAEAAKRQDLFNNKEAVWNKEKALADTEESNRRWNIENERAERNSAGGSAKAFTDQEITATINTLKNNGSDWETIAQYLGEKGIDVSTGSYSDVQLNTAFKSGNYPVKPSTQSFSDKNAEITYNENKKKAEIKNSAKSDSGSATNGEYYWKGTDIYKKKKWGFDELVGDFSK